MRHRRCFSETLSESRTTQIQSAGRAHGPCPPQQPWACPKNRQGSTRDSAQPALRCGADARRTASAARPPRHRFSRNSYSPQPLRCLAKSQPGHEWKERKRRKGRRQRPPHLPAAVPAVPLGGGVAATPPTPLPPATSGGATKVSRRRQRRRCGWSSQETVAPTTSLADTSAGAGACPRHGGCSRLCPPGREGGGWRSREAKRSRWLCFVHARGARPTERSLTPAAPSMPCAGAMHAGLCSAVGGNEEGPSREESLLGVLDGG